MDNNGYPQENIYYNVYKAQKGFILAQSIK